MIAERPAKLIDPVCGMTVDVAGAEAAGLLLEYEGRTWAFCRPGCKRVFVEDPTEYVAAAEVAGNGADHGDDHAHDADGGHPAEAAPARELPIIDEGMRRWYESCACCLSDTYPEIKAQLDAEKAAAAKTAAEAATPVGICEVADAEVPQPAVTMA